MNGYSIYIVIFFELVALFLLSKTLTKSISHVLLQITHNTSFTIYCIALLFLPGTILHECAHFITAYLLRVPVGNMEFIPKIHGDGVKLGSVSIAKTDIFRRMLIGVAPFLVGTTVLVYLLFFFTHNFEGIRNWHTVLAVYVFFEIGNTMFSSPKDLEGTFELGIALSILALVLYIVGIQVPQNLIDFLVNPRIFESLKNISILLLIPLGIDGVVIAISKLFIRLVE